MGTQVAVMQSAPTKYDHAVTVMGYFCNSFKVSALLIIETAEARLRQVGSGSMVVVNNRDATLHNQCKQSLR